MVTVYCTVIICVTLVVIFIAGFYFNFAGNKCITELKRKNNDLRSTIHEIRRIALFARCYTDGAKLKQGINEIIDITE